MLDTIVLTLKKDMFTILDHDKFSPSTQGLFDPLNGYYRLGGRSNIICKQNPTPQELKRGIYKPRLSLTKRLNKAHEFEVTLKIELSLPKLLYGNNFDELVDSDFTLVIQKLKEVLRDMGVYIFEDKLVNAPVSSVHFGKNILLSDYTTPYTYIEQLTKLNINKRLDTNRTDFRNEGLSFKYRANNFEVVFYDKLKDLHQARTSEKRAEETDNAIQLGLFDKVKLNKPLEVLRFEVRLNTKQKLTQMLKKACTESEPTFKSIFKQAVAQKVLLYYIDEIESKYPPLLSLPCDGSKRFFSDYLISHPKIRLTTALKMLGVRILLEEVGVREFRGIINRYSDGAWYDLNREMNKLCEGNNPSVFTLLKSSIREFKSTKLVDISDGMLNNDKYEQQNNRTIL